MKTNRRPFLNIEVVAAPEHMEVEDEAALPRAVELFLGGVENVGVGAYVPDEAADIGAYYGQGEFVFSHVFSSPWKTIKKTAGRMTACRPAARSVL